MVLYCGSGGDGEDLDQVSELEAETLDSTFDQRFPAAEPKEKIGLMKSPSLPSEVRDAWEAETKAMESVRMGIHSSFLSRRRGATLHSAEVEIDTIQFSTGSEGRSDAGPSEMGLCDPEMYQLNKELGTDMAFGEVDHGSRLWFDIGKKSAEQVKVPILDTPERTVHCSCLIGQEPHVYEKAFLQKAPTV
jgi:hypothetical protein